MNINEKSKKDYLCGSAIVQQNLGGQREKWSRFAGATRDRRRGECGSLDF